MIERISFPGFYPRDFILGSGKSVVARTTAGWVLRRLVELGQNVDTEFKTVTCTHRSFSETRNGISTADDRNRRLFEVRGIIKGRNSISFAGN